MPILGPQASLTSPLRHSPCQSQVRRSPFPLLDGTHNANLRSTLLPPFPMAALAMPIWGLQVSLPSPWQHSPCQFSNSEATGLPLSLAALTMPIPGPQVSILSPWRHLPCQSQVHRSPSLPHGGTRHANYGSTDLPLFSMAALMSVLGLQVFLPSLYLEALAVMIPGTQVFWPSHGSTRHVDPGFAGLPSLSLAALVMPIPCPRVQQRRLGNMAGGKRRVGRTTGVAAKGVLYRFTYCM